MIEFVLETPQTGPMGDERRLSLRLDGGRIRVENLLAPPEARLQVDRPTYGYEPHLMGELAHLHVLLTQSLRELRRLAVIRHVRLAQGGGEVHSGYHCEACAAECGPGVDLEHEAGCLLQRLEPLRPWEPKK